MAVDDSLPASQLLENFSSDMNVPSHLYQIYSIKGNDMGPRVFVSLSVNNCSLIALADTGADISVISSSAFEKLGPLGIDNNTLFIVKGVGSGDPFHTMGLVYLDLVIGTFKVSSVPFHVVDSAHMTHDMIIGADFMYEHYLAPSPFHGRLIYAPPSCDSHIEFVGNKVHFSQELSLSRKAKLGAYSLSFISVEDVNIPGNVCYFEPNSMLSEKSVSFCRSLESIDDSRKVILEVACYSDEPVVLDKGTCIGRLWQVEEVGLIHETKSESCELRRKVKSLFDFSDTELNPEQLGQVYDMLTENIRAISFDDCDVGRVDWVSHDIEFVDPDQQPIKIPPRRIHGKIRDRVEEEIKRLHQDDLIEPSNSPWSSPVVPVKKPDGSIRLCIDYRAVNKVTRKDAFPLPNLEDALYNLNGMKYFTSMDLVKGYYQVPMSNQAKPYTAFSTSMGHWQFKRMPFGLCNAPATFQRLMNIVLKNFSWDHVMAYLDDILIMNRNFEDHLEEVRKVLNCLGDHGLKVKPKKCQMFKHEVKFLGHMVSADGLSPNTEYIKAVLEYPVPTTVKQVHSFLGMVNFYRRFIANCSVISRPLSQLLKSKKLEWTQECQDSFERLKTCLVNPPILSYPDYSSDKPLELFTDASYFGAGACLTQEQDGEQKIIAYISTTFNKSELNYSVLDKELTALRWGIKRLKPFLYGHFFVVHTDHKPLSYLQGMKLLDGRLARTLDELGEYDFEIRYVPGKLNTFADALSRTSNCLFVKVPLEPSFYLSGFRERHVKPGADTLFRCMSICKFGDENSHSDIRKETIDHILTKPHLYNVELTSTFKKQLKLSRHEGVMPLHECIQAFANKQEIPVFVFEEFIGFIRYEPIKINEQRKPCYIRSYDSVYFSILDPDGSVDLRDYRFQNRNSDSSAVISDLIDDDNPESISYCEDLTVGYDLVSIQEFQTRSRNSKNSLINTVTCVQSPRNINDITKKVSFNPKITYHCYSEELESELISIGAVKDWQEGCSSLRRLKKIILSNSGNINEIKKACNKFKALRKYSRYVDSIWVNSEGLLIFDSSSGSESNFSYLVPFLVLGEIAQASHERNGHIGYDKLLYLVSNIIFHPTLSGVVSDVVKSCEHCLLHKSYSSPVTPPLINIQTKEPFELVQVDTMELPHSFRGYKYVLNAIDQYSKWFASEPLKDKTSLSCAKAFSNILAGLPKIPKSVMSDNGTEFTGNEFVKLLQDFNIQQKFVTPYSPQSNGLVERVNSTLLNVLTGLCPVPTDWDKYLKQAVIIYNNTLHSEINRTPSELLISLTSRLPLQPKNEAYWKEGAAKFTPYKVGTKVGLRIQGRQGLSKKLRPRFKGPYTVIKVNSNNKSYKLTFKDDDTEVRAHHSQLRPWYDKPNYLQRSPMSNNNNNNFNSHDHIFIPESNIIPGLHTKFEYTGSYFASHPQKKIIKNSTSQSPEINKEDNAMALSSPAIDSIQDVSLQSAQLLNCSDPPLFASPVVSPPVVSLSLLPPLPSSSNSLSTVNSLFGSASRSNTSPDFEGFPQIVNCGLPLNINDSKVDVFNPKLCSTPLRDSNHNFTFGSQVSDISMPSMYSFSVPGVVGECMSVINQSQDVISGGYEMPPLPFVREEPNIPFRRITRQVVQDVFPGLGTDAALNLIYGDS